MATRNMLHTASKGKVNALETPKTSLNAKIKIEPPLLVKYKAPSAPKKKKKETEANEDVKSKKYVKQCM